MFLVRQYVNQLSSQSMTHAGYVVIVENKPCPASAG